MLKINLEWDANALAAPQSFRDAVQAAATILDAAIYNSITANIVVGYGEYDNGSVQLSSNISLGGVGSTIAVSYPLLKAALTGNETSSTDVTAFNALPAATALNGQNTFFITGAQAKALGVISATDPSIDGYTGFPSSFTGTTLVGAAIVEIMHALGLLNDGLVLSLFEYTSPGNHLLTSGTANTPAYFSIDGGVTNLATYDVGSDSTLFLKPSNDPLSAPISGNTTLTSLDLTEISAIGFDVTSAKALQTPTITPLVTASGTSAKLVLQNVSVAVNGSIAVSSLIKSISAPAGDSIASYFFYDQGGGTGYFGVNGVREPDSQWIDVLSTQLQTLQYFGGTSAGSETLEAYAFDYTANTYTPVSLLTATTFVSPDIIAAINTIYENVLGRAADPNGLAAFETALAQPGASIAVVQTSLASSAEAASDINTLYQNVLGRPADPGGLAAFQAALAQPGASLIAVQASLANSPEAAADINTLYQNVVGRNADSGGLAAFQGALAQPGASLSTVQAGLAGSPEAASDINALYRSVLGRNADPGGLAAFQAALAQHGASLGTVQTSLASSQEAASDINNLYQNVLGRNADAGGLATFQQLLTQTGQSLAAVRTDLINSPEAATDIDNIYVKFGGQASPAVVSADTIDGRVQLNAGLSLADLSYQIHFIDSSPTVANITNNTTLTVASTLELIQTQASAIGHSIIANFNPTIDIISLSQVFNYSSIINSGQQTTAGFQINLGSSNSILLSNLNESALVPHDFRFVG